MKRILITGMSGTGKSSVIKKLRELGFHGIDMDEAGWSHTTSDGDWQWREDRVRDLLSSVKNDEIVFISGCSENQGKFYPQLDAIILLSAPTALIIERLKTRTTNTYGKDPAELAETLGYINTVEPLLRKGASHEIDTSLPLDVVVARILEIMKSLN